MGFHFAFLPSQVDSFGIETISNDQGVRRVDALNQSGPTSAKFAFDLRKAAIGLSLHRDDDQILEFRSIVLNTHRANHTNDR